MNRLEHPGCLVAAKRRGVILAEGCQSDWRFRISVVLILSWVQHRWISLLIFLLQSLVRGTKSCRRKQSNETDFLLESGEIWIDAIKPSLLFVGRGCWARWDMIRRSPPPFDPSIPLFGEASRTIVSNMFSLFYRRSLQILWSLSCRLILFLLFLSLCWLPRLLCSRLEARIRASDHLCLCILSCK